MPKRALIIRRFALGSLAQWGFVSGALIACLPAFVCSWGFFTLIQAARGLLASWREVGFEILGQRLSFNMVEVLNLKDLLQLLTNVASVGVLGIVVLAMLGAVALGIFGALVLMLLGAFYNLTGRLRVEVEEVSADTHVQAP
ncbi:MAG: hypothetical protein HY741_09160 [Chloroflexi bacterium]|nr:hypothetical protein [Chloroflexota bacterium]